MTDINYDELKKILDQALDQVKSGKGSERHGMGIPFHEQPWRFISNNVGDGFVVGQAVKKLMELRVFSMKMESAEDKHELQSAFKSWKREALGAIVYTALAILWNESEHMPELIKNLPANKLFPIVPNCE